MMQPAEQDPKQRKASKIDTQHWQGARCPPLRHEFTLGSKQVYDSPIAKQDRAGAGKLYRSMATGPNNQGAAETEPRSPWEPKVRRTADRPNEADAA